METPRPRGIEPRPLSLHQRVRSLCSCFFFHLPHTVARYWFLVFTSFVPPPLTSIMGWMVTSILNYFPGQITPPRWTSQSNCWAWIQPWWLLAIIFEYHPYQHIINHCLPFYKREGARILILYRRSSDRFGKQTFLGEEGCKNSWKIKPL